MSERIDQGRRRLLGAAAMTLATAQIGMTDPAKAQPGTKKNSFDHVALNAESGATDASVVLVHGAWANGSGWARVITRLQSRAIKTIAAPIPLTSLSDDVAALERTLERTEGPIILAGDLLRRRGKTKPSWYPGR